MSNVSFLPNTNSIGYVAEERTARNLLTRDMDIASTAEINISHVAVQYHMVEALQDINCVVQPGQMTGIFGPNGAGKSTLLKAMLGLVPLSSGSVIYQGKPLVQQLEKVAYVPQRSQVDWTYPATVWDVIMMVE